MPARKRPRSRLPPPAPAPRPQPTPTGIVANASTFTWSGGLENGVSLVDARLRSADVQGGDFDLLSPLAGLEAMTQETNATKIVFDGIDALLSLLDPAAERREVYRLNEWLSSTGLKPETDLELRQRQLQDVVRAEHLRKQQEEEHLTSIRSLRGGDIRNQKDRTSPPTSSSGKRRCGRNGDERLVAWCGQA